MRFSCDFCAKGSGRWELNYRTAIVTGTAVSIACWLVAQTLACAAPRLREAPS
jgi:hypothetical protein